MTILIFEAAPKSCANIDGVRGGACFHTAEALAACFQQLSEHASIRYLRVKNGFAAEKGNYGYRAVLVNMEFQAPDATGGASTTTTWLRAPAMQCKAAREDYCLSEGRTTYYFCQGVRGRCWQCKGAHMCHVVCNLTLPHFSPFSIHRRHRCKW